MTFIRYFTFGYKLTAAPLVARVKCSLNGPWDWGSIPGRITPETQKVVLDTCSLNTQHYKVSIEGKVEQSRERSSALF